MSLSSAKRVSLVQIAPMALVLVCFVILPLAMILVVSFMDYGFAEVIPEFIWENYLDIFTSELTLKLYLQTFKFLAIVWAITLFLGFTIAYYLMFHVRSPIVRALCIAACAIPFWTSGPIRMVSWVPLLGREGLVNQVLLHLHIIEQPLSWLLYSEFSVIVVYVNVLTLAMLGPIANSMAKIDKNLLHAARDQGASEGQIIRLVIIPLIKPGIAIGSIFIVTAVMGDFFIVKQMGGGQINTAVGAIATELNAFQYPPAAAKSVVMLVIVLGFVASLLRVVDIRKELANQE
ncbi:ABC transporter permease [Agrobacterium vitis]|uniref:ABC transporter permease n=1 Tax=Agrobacterium vitis TaxID=373 RepID=UPI0015DB24C3|nr:ABC transporter permease [Agrobacterium vitis]MCF1455027.1 ABC transporter permease [Agrobacterium vitis]BCH57090.1 spermidine/putrescine ABC transporter permease [Agrobacterium vitis]